MRSSPVSSVRTRRTGWLVPRNAVAFTGIFVESCTGPVLNWMLSALNCLPVSSSLYSTRALLTVRLSMSRRIGCGGFSGWAGASAVAALAGAGLPAGAAAVGTLPMSSQLPWPFLSRFRRRFSPSTRTSLICTSRRNSGSTRTDRPSICKSAYGSVGLIRVATLASCSSRPSHGNRLQPMSPLSVSSMWALSRAIWRISSL
ncbi:hypothetical protein D3C76_500240 [compost metagenome]